jgi:hypothetical protein
VKISPEVRELCSEEMLDVLHTVQEMCNTKEGLQRTAPSVCVPVSSSRKNALPGEDSDSGAHAATDLPRLPAAASTLCTTPPFTPSQEQLSARCFRRSGNPQLHAADRESELQLGSQRSRTVSDDDRRSVFLCCCGILLRFSFCLDG